MHKDDTAVQRAMGYKSVPQLTHIALAAAKCFVLLHEDAEVSKFVSESTECYRALVDCARDKGLHNIPDGTAEYLRLVDAISFLQLEDC